MAPRSFDPFVARWASCADPFSGFCNAGGAGDKMKVAHALSISHRKLAAISLFEQATYLSGVVGSRIRVGCVGGKLGGTIQVGLVHPYVAQRARHPEPRAQLRHAFGGVFDAQRAGKLGDRIGHYRSVIAQHVGQHDAVDFGVGQVEAATQRVAQLVMQTHGDQAKHRSAQRGAIKTVAAGGKIAWAPEGLGERVSQPADPFFREK
jgi:hypothetical protein